MAVLHVVLGAQVIVVPEELLLTDGDPVGDVVLVKVHRA